MPAIALAGALVLCPSAGAVSLPAKTTLRAAYTSFPDYLDPQLSYTSEGWTAMYDTYVPLLTFKHAAGRAGTQVVPGLARSLPKITDGGRTYTLQLRSGLRYSNRRPVRAGDFKFAIERMFRLHSGGSSFYLDIVGAPSFRDKGRGGITGIQVDDQSGTIVIHLERPSSTFSDKLALLFAAPVPPGTPMHDASADPPPATGPYEIAGVRFGRGWSYDRNPAWAAHNAKAMPQLPSGHVGRIEVAVVRNDSAAVNAIAHDRLDWMFDPPPVSRYAEVKRRFGGTQFRVERTLSLFYFWMNMTRPPFDDVRVRRAVNYAVDARALERIYFDQLAPTQQILPRGMPGYRRFELFPHDLATAKRLVAEANPSDREITVWTDREPPNFEAGAYYAAVLRQLGFEVTLEAVAPDSYFSVIGRAATPNLDTGWSDWYQDYPHPDDFFRPLLDGSSIQSRDNVNFSRIEAPALDEWISRLDEVPLGRQQEDEYAALDRSFMEVAPIAPFGNRTLSTFVSRRVKLGKVVWSPVFGDDLTSFRLRPTRQLKARGNGPKAALRAPRPMPPATAR